LCHGCLSDLPGSADVAVHERLSLPSLALLLCLPIVTRVADLALGPPYRTQNAVSASGFQKADNMISHFVGLL
jgi:hypothetical protein